MKKFYLSIFIILSVITFSSLVIGPDIAPRFLGMPRTLWAGILISILMSMLTLLLSVHMKKEEDE